MRSQTFNPVNLGHIVRATFEKAERHTREQMLQIAGNADTIFLLTAIHQKMTQQFLAVVAHDGVEAEVITEMRVQLRAVCSVIETLNAFGIEYGEKGIRHQLLDGEPKPEAQEEVD